MEEINVLCPKCECWLAKHLCVKIGNKYFCESCAKKLKKATTTQNANTPVILDSEELVGQSPESSLNQPSNLDFKFDGVNKDEF